MKDKNETKKKNHQNVSDNGFIKGISKYSLAFYFDSSITSRNQGVLLSSTLRNPSTFVKKIWDKNDQGKVLASAR